MFAGEPGIAPTATALLDVAERLFEQKGIAAVSLRQIVIAAGQRNLSAAHDHFGSGEGLIHVVVERRMRTIDANRLGYRAMVRGLVEFMSAGLGAPVLLAPTRVRA